MSRHLLIAALALFVTRGVADAQTTLPYDHVHLAAPDQAAAVEWYRKNLGGQLSAEGKDRVTFGKTRFIFLKAAAAQPSAGTAIDHIGFSFADVDAKMKELEAAGVKVTPVREAPGSKVGFIDDPWGVKIELVQDPELLGFHHIHLRAPDKAASLAWYKERFGGQPAKWKGLDDGLKYGDVWVFVMTTTGNVPPSVGHAIDHLGWRVPDLEKILGDLKAKNIKVLQGTTALTLATGVVHYSFVEDPAGTKIEIVQR
jgi:catechol 2,3-dioxygenase-like lactoylglutathione lyase family enzyme